MQRQFRNARMLRWLTAAGIGMAAVNAPAIGSDRAPEKPTFVQRLSHVLSPHGRKATAERKSSKPIASEARQVDENSEPPRTVIQTAAQESPASTIRTGSRFPRIASDAAGRAGESSPAATQVSLLNDDVFPIDLASALQLAGAQNPEVLIAQQRTVAATAQQQYMAAKILPTLNLGTNYDSHTGLLQQSSGNILKINRNAVYVGAGADAVAAGTVNIPGLVYNLNPAESIYRYLASRQAANASSFGRQAVNNIVLLEVTQTYADLLLDEGLRSNAILTRNEAREVAKLTSDHATTGLGRPADADRAATELARRETEVLTAEAAVLASSARLAALLSLESSLRLQTTDNWVVPRPIVPDMIPLGELLAIALVQRPELNDRRSLVAAALLDLQSAKALPFSPNVILGYSAGGFAGGSDVIAAQGKSLFGSLHDRADLDVIAYWSLKNCGAGNHALVQIASSRWRQSDLELLGMLNRVQQEVTDAYVRTQTRFAEIDTREQAVRSSQEAFDEDLIRIRSAEGRPIELLDSLRLLREARNAYLRTIIDYNRAHYELYVMLGQPPANMLVRPAGDNVNDGGTPLPPPPEAKE